MSRDPIIGLVGGSTRPRTVGEQEWMSIRRAAYEVGREVGSLAILLTGGSTPDRDVFEAHNVQACHQNAMRGALDVGGRVIGILPNRFGNKRDLKPGDCELYIDTKLTSHQRNYVNGMTPDIVIALPGGAETLSEVAIAAHAARPVIFLNSLDILKRQQGVTNVLADIKSTFASISIADVYNALERVLETSAVVRSPLEAVCQALAVVSRPLEGTHYPGTVPGDTFEDGVRVSAFGPRVDCSLILGRRRSYRITDSDTSDAQLETARRYTNPRPCDATGSAPPAGRTADYTDAAIV